MGQRTLINSGPVSGGRVKPAAAAHQQLREGRAATQIALGTTDVAQEFMTGPHPSGYDLDSIDLRLDILINARLLIVTLHSGSANGTKVADLTRRCPW